MTKGGLQLVHTDPALIISQYAGSNNSNTSGVFNAVIVSQDVYDNITRTTIQYTSCRSRRLVMPPVYVGNDPVTVHVGNVRLDTISIGQAIINNYT